jgi:hypothetical protein
MTMNWRTILNGLLAPAASVSIPAVASAPDAVIVNGAPLSQEQVQGLERLYQVRVRNGNYWYDQTSGLWGVIGGPAGGVILPNLAIGGPLHPKASNGTTRVFINGRELHALDVLFLQTLGPVLPGRYWLDALGNCGLEGHPVPFVNLLVLMQQQGMRRDHYWSNGASSFNSEGGFMYYQGKDAAGNYYHTTSGD